MAEKDKTQEQETIQLLQTLKETPPRDPEQAAQGRQAFLAQAQEISNQPVSIPLFQRLISVFNQPRPQLRFSTLTIGLILAALLLTFSSTAIAARLSKPDQILYNYKLWLEESRLSLTTKPASQIDLHLVFAEERLKELAADSSGYSDLGVGRAVHNLTDHVKALQSLSDDDQVSDEQRERLEAILLQYERYEEKEHEDELEDELEEEIDDSSAGSEDDEQKPEDEDPEKPEDKEEESDDEDEKEIKNDKHSKDSEDLHHPEETEDPSDDDREVESTEEPDDDPSDHSDSSDEDPTETPEPDDD